MVNKSSLTFVVILLILTDQCHSYVNHSAEKFHLTETFKMRHAFDERRCIFDFDSIPSAFVSKTQRFETSNQASNDARPVPFRHGAFNFLHLAANEEMTHAKLRGHRADPPDTNVPFFILSHTLSLSLSLCFVHTDLKANFHLFSNVFLSSVSHFWKLLSLKIQRNAQSLHEIRLFRA